MTDPNTTLIVTVLDRTGSMSSIRDSVCEEYNGFIAEQRTVTGDHSGSCYVTLFQFDTQDPAEIVYEWKSIYDVPQLRLEPRAGTPLYDAIGHAVVRTGEQLEARAEHERPGQVFFVIVTDGQENSSTEWTKDRVRELITRQSEKYSWEFHFVGVGIDSFAEAGQLNISAKTTYQGSHDRAGVQTVYAGVSGAITRSRLER
jgi:hypothetical protein